MDGLMTVHAKVMLIEIICGKPYTCLALTPANGKEIMKVEDKEAYLFEISKAD